MLKFFATSCLITISICSAYLTLMFMIGLGPDTSTMVILAIIGIVLDLVKSVMPLFIINVYEKNYATSFFLIIMFIGLVSVSFTASVYSIDKGFNNNTNTTTSNENWDAKVALKRTELANLQTQFDNQVSINHISRSDKTATKISKVTNELEKMLDDKPKSILNDYSSMITMLISGLIEMVTLILALVLNFCTNTPIRNISNVTQPLTNTIKKSRINKSKKDDERSTEDGALAKFIL